MNSVPAFGRSDRLWLATTFLFYFVFTLSVYFVSDGFAYIIDNNESFGTLNHAKNLLAYPIAESFALTDESSGTTEGAHPFVYTHNGNFQRFWSSFLYFAGLTGVQDQILATILTIGSLGVLCAFLAVRNLADSKTAAVVCLVLSTCYLGSLRFFLNTWQIWLLVLPLILLWLVLGQRRRNEGFRLGAIVVLAFCLAYSEWTRAVMAVTALLVTLLYFRRRKKLSGAMPRAVALLAGTALAAALLIVQIVAYGGLDLLLTDLQLTESARNEVGTQNTLNAEMAIQVLLDNNVVFLETYAPTYPGALFLPLLARVSVGLMAGAPLVLLIPALTVFVRVLLGNRKRRVHQNESRSVPWSFDLAAGIGFAALAVSLVAGSSPDPTEFASSNLMFITWMVIGLASGSVLHRLLPPRMHCQPLQKSFIYWIPVVTALVAVATVEGIPKSARIVGCSVLALYPLTEALARNLARTADQATLDAWSTRAFNAQIGGLVALGVLYPLSIADSLGFPQVGVVFSFGQSSAIKGIYAAISVVVSLLALNLLERSKIDWSQYRSLAAVIAIWLIAPTVTIAAFPGYAETVLLRYWQPLYVFPVALALSLLLVLVLQGLSFSKATDRASREWLQSHGTKHRRVTRIYVLATSTVLVVAWAMTQVSLVRTFPPNEWNGFFAAMKQLEGDGGVISNGYSGLMSVASQTWAYSGEIWDPSEAQSKRRTNVWFADRFMNDSYGNPRYRVCFTQPTVSKPPLQGPCRIDVNDKQLNGERVLGSDLNGNWWIIQRY